MKRILILLSLTLMFAGCQSVQETPQKLAIDAVYKKDAAITSNSKTAAEVVATMSSMDLTGCPEAFVKAYKADIEAWTALANLEKQMYKVNISKAKSDMESFIYDFKRNSAKAIIRLKDQWPQFANEIDVIGARINITSDEVINAGTSQGSIYPSLGWL